MLARLDRASQLIRRALTSFKRGLTSRTVEARSGAGCLICARMLDQTRSWRAHLLTPFDVEFCVSRQVLAHERRVYARTDALHRLGSVICIAGDAFRHSG